MVDKTEIVSQLKNIIVQELDVNVSEADISEDVLLFEGGLGLDSVILVELIALIEKKLAVRFSDDELNPELFSTLSVLADFISKKKATG
jgi:acyl carrier protein